MGLLRWIDEAAGRSNQKAMLDLMKPAWSYEYWSGYQPGLSVAAYRTIVIVMTLLIWKVWP